MTTPIIQPGQPLTLPQMRSLAEDAVLTPRQARELRRAIERAEQTERNRQLERRRAEEEQFRQEHDVIAAEISLLTEAGPRIAEAMETGRIDGMSARRDVTTLNRDLKQARERAEQLRRTDEESWALACRSVDEAQDERLRRFPHLRATLPRLNPEFLEGRSSEPFV